MCQFCVNQTRLQLSLLSITNTEPSHSLKVRHNFKNDGGKPIAFLEDKSVNPACTVCVTNNGLLISWLLGTIKEQAQ